MSNIVKAAIVQTAWTGDKDSMIELHEKYLAEAPGDAPYRETAEKLLEQLQPALNPGS